MRTGLFRRSWDRRQRGQRQLRLGVRADGGLLHHGPAASSRAAGRPDRCSPGGDRNRSGPRPVRATRRWLRTKKHHGSTALNPWDLLLCLEGTLLFAAAATKRLEGTSAGAVAFPFTVRAVGAGAGTVALGDEANARAETWFPLWDRPASLAELAGIFAEGRVQVSGRTARETRSILHGRCPHSGFSAVSRHSSDTAIFSVSAGM